MNFFSEQIEGLKSKANSIAIRNNDDTINKIDKAKLETNPYYYYGAVNSLKNYKAGLSGISEIGLYFEDMDYVLTSSYKYSLDEFSRVFTGSPENREELLRFFKEGGKTRLYSNFDTEQYHNARLFIGYPVLWNAKNKAVFFYIVKSDFIKSALFTPQNTSPNVLCICDDEGRLLFANGSTEDMPFIARELGLRKEKDKAGMVKTSFSQQLPYTIFASRSPSLQMSFVSLFWRNEVEENINRFYKNLTGGLFINLTGFLLLFALTVYINYKPIFKIVNRLKQHGIENNDSEIRSILSALDKMEFTVAELRTVATDHILSNLLQGGQISNGDKKHIAGFLSGKVFIVFLALGLRLDSWHREELISAAAKNYGTNLCIVDVLQKNQIAFLFSMENENGVTALKRHLYTLFASENVISMGKAVKSCEEIYDSYLYATEMMSNNTDVLSVVLSRKEAYDVLQNDIFRYVEENLFDAGLCRNKIADKFGMSIYSLSRIFKEKTGVGVKEYINDKRLERSKHLMLTTDMTISNISESIGFVNTDYFPKLFKGKYGCSPSEFRNEYITKQ